MIPRESTVQPRWARMTDDFVREHGFEPLCVELRHGPRSALDLYVLPQMGRARHLASVPLSGSPILHNFIAIRAWFDPPLRLSFHGTWVGR